MSEIPLETRKKMGLNTAQALELNFFQNEF